MRRISTIWHKNQHLSGLQSATESTAQVPLVQALREAGIAQPFSAGSPVPDTAALQAATNAGINQAGFQLLERLESIPNQSNGAKALAEIEDLKSFAREQAAGTADDPIYITATDPLPVEIKGGEVEVKGQVEAKIVNTEPIPVETGTVQVVIAGLPVSVRIEDLGALISQLSAGNTARDAFGGQTI